MAPKNKEPKAERPLAYGEVVDAMEALFINLPGDATITLDGATLGYQEILTRLDEWREELAIQARIERLRANSPPVALEARVFARQVRDAINRRLDAEAYPDFEPANRLSRRALAAAKGGATRELRGIHLRRRPASLCRRPWVH